MKTVVKSVICVFLLSLVLLVGSFPVLALDKIDVNTATIDQLVQVKGVGEVLAQRIIDYRQDHKSFKNLDELMNVKGVGSKKLEQMLPSLTLSQI